MNRLLNRILRGLHFAPLIAAAGAWFSVTTYFTALLIPVHPAIPSRFDPAEAVAIAPCGAWFGLLVSPIAIICLSGKPLRRTMIYLIVIGTPLSMLTPILQKMLSRSLLGAMAPDVSILALSFLWFAIVCAVLYSVLPDKCFDHRRCVSCGYDLTGNTSGKCPECGTFIPSEQKEAINDSTSFESDETAKPE